MSQGPSPSRPSSPPSDDTTQALASRESRTLPPITDSYRPTSERPGFYSATSVQDVSGRPRTPSGPDQWHSRPIGVQNLLNPTNREHAKNQSRRRTAEHFDFRSSLGGSSPRMTSTSLSQSPSDSSLPSITPPSTSAYPSQAGLAPHRTLTPRSLSAFAINPFTVNPPVATIDAKTSPFVTTNDRVGPDMMYLPESTLGPALPGVPHSFPEVHQPSSGRRTSGSNLQHQNFLTRRGSGGAGLQPTATHSESPSTSYSSYSRLSHTPPATQPNVSLNQPTSSYYAPYNGNGTASAISQMGYDSKHPYTTAASSMAQGTYHLMTLDTEQGPIQVPVDVQAASKVADEKRKRNATASHRFRQRRKEKERETSSNIAKLEHQIREMAEERDYYRSERDFFRSVSAGGVPSHAVTAPRPPSPRHLRQAQLGSSGSFVGTQWQETEESNREARNTRRRTSAYVPVLGPPPQAPVPTVTNRYSQVPSNVPGILERPSMDNRSHVQGQNHSPAGPFNPSTVTHGWKANQ